MRCARFATARRLAARGKSLRAPPPNGFDWEKVTGRYFDLYDELHALVRGGRREPALAPAFYSTAARSIAQ
ncbi:MAG: hypothetical protein WDO73_03535 [Ignavibacteriota bacterium]